MNTRIGLQTSSISIEIKLHVTCQVLLNILQPQHQTQMEIDKTRTARNLFLHLLFFIGLT